MNISGLFRLCGQKTSVNKKHVEEERLIPQDKEKSGIHWRCHFTSMRGAVDKPKARSCAEKIKQFRNSISRYFRGLFNKPVVNPHGEQQQVENTTLFRTARALSTLQERYINATERALLALKCDPAVYLKETRENSARLLNQQDRPLSKDELQQAQTFKPMLINKLKHVFITMGLSEHDAKQQAKQAFAGGLREELGTKEWQTISTRFHHNGLRYGCTLVPAAEMKVGHRPLFCLPHEMGGIPSSATKMAEHATNLWTSELCALDKEEKSTLLFKGIRHGILSPFGLSAYSDTRFEGARTRALEVVIAALYARPDLMHAAQQGQVVNLKLASTSLVTGGHGGEKEMLNDQMQAWKYLSEERGVRIPLRNANGETYLANVNLDVAAFNFGVNELALKANLGWRQADRYNVDALKTLLGDNLAVTAEPQGWVGRYLADNPMAQNAHKVRELSEQLKRIWAEQSHHSDGGEPYKAALRVSLLAYEIGAVPCWNCKSGKDRTSMLDAELKREVVKIHQKSRGLVPPRQIVSTPGAPLASNERRLLQTILRFGGNKDIQEYNTGAPGNKVIRALPWPINLSTRQRIGDDKVYIDIKGLSSLV